MRTLLCARAQVLLQLARVDADLDLAQANSATPLHIAVSMGHTEAVEVLLAQGADPDAQNSTGNTALHIAASKGAPAGSSPAVCLLTPCLP